MDFKELEPTTQEEAIADKVGAELTIYNDGLETAPNIFQDDGNIHAAIGERRLCFSFGQEHSDGFFDKKEARLKALLNLA